MNPNSDLTCLSISERAQKGWKFWAEKDYAKLISPLTVGAPIGHLVPNGPLFSAFLR